LSPEAPDQPESAEQVSFASDVRPLFRESDREAMRRAFDLWQYEDVVSHATAIAEKLHDGTMPCDGPWPTGQVELFDRWVSLGTPR
jgi:hypothetical protein